MHNKNMIAPISKVAYNQSDARLDTAVNLDTHEDLINTVSPATMPKPNYEPTIIQMGHDKGGFLKKDAY